MRFYRDSRTWSGPYLPWFLDGLDIERRATMLRTWEPLLIPGLLQTPDYAHAVFASWRRDSGEDIGREVRARRRPHAGSTLSSPMLVRAPLSAPVL